MPKGVYKRIIGINCGLPTQGFQRKHPVPKEWRENLSKIHKGKKLSEEHKEKISQTMKGKPKPWFKGKPSWSKGKRCPQVSLRQKGNRNPNWKGGITPENERLRHSVRFKLWREKIFERDNYTCQRCKKKGGRLHPHHIKSFVSFPKLRFEVDNGITLCKTCHKNIHDERKRNSEKSYQNIRRPRMGLLVPFTH